MVAHADGQISEEELYEHVRHLALVKAVEVLTTFVDLHLHHLRPRDDDADPGLHHLRALPAARNSGQAPRGDRGVQGRADVRRLPNAPAVPRRRLARDVSLFCEPRIPNRIDMTATDCDCTLGCHTSNASRWSPTSSRSASPLSSPPARS